MLTTNITATPRPRPPAKARRVSSTIKSNPTGPPPPYAITSPSDSDPPHDPRKSTLLGSPILMTAQMLGWDTHEAAPVVEDWVNEKSREELSELLLKADGLIRERETELTMTTAVCKNLYDSNIELKIRHQALLARLPISPTISPTPSESASPGSTSSSPPHSPQFYSSSISRPSSHLSTSSIGAPRHHRRISVSPSDIALLSDQNAELLHKLEKLESESLQADQAGRRKLKKLEKEIQGLRDELDCTRARSEELEEKAKKARNNNTEDIWKRKLEREERVRALRRRSGHELDFESEEIRDFSPGGALSVSGSSPALGLGLPTAMRVASPNRCVSEYVSCRPATQNISEEEEDLVSPPTSTSPPVHEFALISQLLSKIRELEETNSQITEQQVRTAEQMHSVQRDAASIRRVYESLGEVDDVDWKVVDDETDEVDVEDVLTGGSETIRFRNLRQSLDRTPSRTFERGIATDMQSTLRHALIPQNLPVAAAHIHAHKARKSVVGLFDVPGAFPIPVHNNDANEPPLPIPLPIPFSPNASEPPSSSGSPVCGFSPVEPPLRTLDSELRAELGTGEWGVNNGDHHFRTSSLYNLTAITPHASSISINPEIHAPVPIVAHQAFLNLNRIPPTSSNSPKPTTPSDEILVPGTWRSSPGTWHSSRSESHAEKKRRMSQTIRQRTSRWGEGRFTDSLLSSNRPALQSLDIRTITPIPQRLANVFEAVVDTVAGPREVHDDESPVESPTDLLVDGNDEQKHGGVVSFVLELWLWLQFVIIILVFLWAMAKRGPKSVLEDAERRKVVAR